MRNITIFLFLVLLPTVAFTQQEFDSTKYYRDKIKGIEAKVKEMELKWRVMEGEQLKEDSITQSFEEAYQDYKVVRFTGDLYLKVGTGSVAVDLGPNLGYFTGSTEVGVRFRSYFEATSRSGIRYQAPFSLYGSFGWGPTLVGDNLIPNYLYYGFGGIYERVNSSIFLGGVAAHNVSDDGTMNMYGATLGVDGVTTPTYITFLKGDGFKYIFLVGFKISLSNFVHWKYLK